MTADYERDLELVSAWISLTDPERHEVVRLHLASLSGDGIEKFREHTRRMCVTIAGQIDDHEAAENQSWGPYIEDQISYMNAKLATGRSDPQWLAQRAELLRYAALFQLVASTAG